MSTTSSLPRIGTYQLIWNVKTRMGTIHLQFVNPSTQPPIIVDALDATSFHALHMMLLHEKPIFWDAATETIRTGPEPVGEEERD